MESNSPYVVFTILIILVCILMLWALYALRVKDFAIKEAENLEAHEQTCGGKVNFVFSVRTHIFEPIRYYYMCEDCGMIFFSYNPLTNLR